MYAVSMAVAVAASWEEDSWKEDSWEEDSWEEDSMATEALMRVRGYKYELESGAEGSDSAGYAGSDKGWPRGRSRMHGAPARDWRRGRGPSGEYPAQQSAGLQEERNVADQMAHWGALEEGGEKHFGVKRRSS